MMYRQHICNRLILYNQETVLDLIWCVYCKNIVWFVAILFPYVIEIVSNFGSLFAITRMRVGLFCIGVQHLGFVRYVKRCWQQIGGIFILLTKNTKHYISYNDQFYNKLMKIWKKEEQLASTLLRTFQNSTYRNL